MNRSIGTDFALVAGVAAEIVVIVGLLASIVRPSRRFWPPGERSWAFYLYWCCGTVLTVSGVVVGIYDRGSWREGTERERTAGAIAVVLGVLTSAEAGRELRIGDSVGLEGRLYTGGLYRYSRNPQYVGNLLAITGATLATGSKRFALLAFGAVLWHFCLPFAEEPWLAEQYGERYRKYLNRVPRFVGSRTVKRLFDRG